LQLLSTDILFHQPAPASQKIVNQRNRCSNNGAAASLGMESKRICASCLPLVYHCAVLYRVEAHVLPGGDDRHCMLSHTGNNVAMDPWFVSDNANRSVKWPGTIWEEKEAKAANHGDWMTIGNTTKAIKALRSLQRSLRQ
jgi:hypothetical protein